MEDIKIVVFLIAVTQVLNSLAVEISYVKKITNFSYFLWQLFSSHGLMNDLQSYHLCGSVLAQTRSYDISLKYNAHITTLLHNFRRVKVNKKIY